MDDGPQKNPRSPSSAPLPVSFCSRLPGKANPALPAYRRQIRQQHVINLLITRTHLFAPVFLAVQPPSAAAPISAAASPILLRPQEWSSVPQFWPPILLVVFRKCKSVLRNASCVHLCAHRCNAFF